MKVVNYEETENKDRSKSYIWLEIGGAEGKKVVFYKYSYDRTADNAIELLQDFSGYLMCDVYQAYDAAVKSLPNNILITHCWKCQKRLCKHTKIFSV